ncbi:MAG: D-alanine--D-alanine ligase [Alteromonadaceae bacterium]|nr:D-alanine--D-alanine ligase [Alteromonadaceae bacterium]
MPEKIAVVYGGLSAEREVSLNSGRAIANGLQQAGFEVLLFDTRDEDILTLKDKDIDLVFIALHGRGGEDGCIQGALEYMGLPYTGSDVLGSALSMDKIRSKQIFQSLNLPTAPFVIAEKARYKSGDNQQNQAEQILNELGGKVMVKPATEGSSIGMAKAENPVQLDNALIAAFEFDEYVLIEAWIDGPEYTVSILGEQALPVIHMVTPNEFYDYDAKYQSTSTVYNCPCGLSEKDELALQLIALKAFKATGAKVWGRVDLMRIKQGEALGKWQLLEVNTVPGMTETSLVPKAAKEFGLNFSELVKKIVEISVANVREKFGNK